MCGLFGFAGTQAHDGATLALAASLASRRGPDSWGMLADGRRFANIGRLKPGQVNGLAPSLRVLGHCRLATVLGTKTVDGCQPIQVGRWAITHNGTVMNVPDLQRRFGFELRTGVDSEAIAHLLGAFSPDLATVMRAVEHGGHFAVVAMNLDSGRVAMMAQGLPLWRLDRADGAYWCSVRPGDGWEPLHA